MKQMKSILCLTLVLVFLLGLLPGAAIAIEPDNTTYTYKAALMTDCPGVYKVTPAAGETGSTIGFPSIAKQNLTDNPTTESPAIIMGAAVPYETRERGKVSPDMFKLNDPGKPVEAPYSYFRPAVVLEQNTTAATSTDGQHYKMSGFDGTYVILRIDVTNLIKDGNGDIIENGYLHVKQWGNKALLVAIGEQTNLTFDAEGNPQDGQTMSYGTFASAWTPDVNTHAALGSKTGSYSLANAAAALKSTDGADTVTPYIDVVLLASGSMVAGGDKNAVDQGDVEISFYVDDSKYYEKTIPDEILTGGHTTAMSYAKASELAMAQQQQQQGSGTETTPTVTLEDLYLQKYYQDTAPAGTSRQNAATYIIKGSDLALEVMMEGDTSRQNDGATEYWSMDKALEHSYYDGVSDAKDVDGNVKTGAVIRLMSEVPVLEGLSLTGDSASSLKKRTLDVNTFDIQIADNTSGAESKAGLTLSNAWLELMDSNTTTGSELAVGNNATMVIKAGGKLIIDEDCQLEVEYDAASVAPAADGQQPAQTYEIHNGVLTVEADGEILNNGVLTIEGTEAKPIDPTVGKSTAATSKGQIINRGTITNNGCLSINGEFFNLGMLENTGKYDKTITSNDPDKGTFTYHKGIQLSWKDDVTQNGQSSTSGNQISIVPGMLLNGMDPENNQFVSAATLINSGDIVCAPGVIYNFGDFRNETGATVNLALAVKAVIPITPTQENPTVVTQEKILSEPSHSAFINAYSWEGKLAPAVVENDGCITTAMVDVPNNGVLGTLTAPAYLDVSSYDNPDNQYLCPLVMFDNYGSFYLGNNGKLVLPLERNFNRDRTISVLNCDSAELDEAAHAGQIMTKNTETAGGAATLKQEDVTVPYTTFTTSGPSFTASPASIESGETVTLSATVSAWSGDPLMQENAPSFDVSGTNYAAKSLACGQVENAANGSFYTLRYSDTVKLSAAGRHMFTGDVDGRGFITADTSVSVVSSAVGGGGGGGGVAAPVTNPVTVPDAAASAAAHGSVKSSAANAKAGDKVTLTLTPDEGYQAAGVTVTDKNGKSVPVTKNTDGTYSFTMPATAVTVTPAFEQAAAPVDPDDTGNTDNPSDGDVSTRFKDVPRDAWYHDAVQWAVDKGIMNGVSSDTFAPNSDTTRAMVVTMLWRMAGEPAAAEPAPFTDVSSDAWYADAVAWAAQTGAVKGTSETTFSPDTPVTREQLAAILYRYAQAQGKGFTGAWMFPLDYSDAADVSEWANEAMHWMTMKGVITGMGDGTLAPGANATRAQIATMFMRFADAMAE